MPFFAIIAVVGVIIFAAYILMNRKDDARERDGIVRDILKKDALAVDFLDGRVTVVKFFGITLASDTEMLDDKIFAFLDGALRGARVLVKANEVGHGDVVAGEVRTHASEYVNALLVRQGFARWSPGEAAADSQLMEAQELAKREQLGVWNPAIRQLAEERMRAASAEMMGEGEESELAIDPEQERL